MDCQNHMQRMDYCHVNGLRILARIIARSYIKGQQGRHWENIKRMSGELVVDDVEGESLDEKNNGKVREKDNECGADYTKSRST